MENKSVITPPEGVIANTETVLVELDLMHAHCIPSCGVEQCLVLNGLQCKLYCSEDSSLSL